MDFCTFSDIVKMALLELSSYMQTTDGVSHLNADQWQCGRNCCRNDRNPEILNL